MDRITKPCFPWVGGKEKLAPYITQLFPQDLTQYTDPFGGSGSVLLALRPSHKRIDIYNDLDTNLTNFCLCAKERTNELVRELKYLPIHSRTAFHLYKHFLEHEEYHRMVYEQNIQKELAVLEDRSCFTAEQAEELRPVLSERFQLFDVQRAAIFFTTIRGSFSGTGNSFGVKPLHLGNFLYLIQEAGRRLEGVVIENKNAIQLIRDEDHPRNLFYCDPPYRKTENRYRVSRHGDFRYFHVRLWRMLKECQSFVVVSYNDCPFIRSLYRDFYILALARPNPLAKKQGAKFEELIMTNYDPRPFLAPQLDLFDLQRELWDPKLVHIPDRPLKLI